MPEKILQWKLLESLSTRSVWIWMRHSSEGEENETIKYSFIYWCRSCSLHVYTSCTVILSTATYLGWYTHVRPTAKMFLFIFLCICISISSSPRSQSLINLTLFINITFSFDCIFQFVSTRVSSSSSNCLLRPRWRRTEEKSRVLHADEGWTYGLRPVNNEHTTSSILCELALNWELK